MQQTFSSNAMFIISTTPFCCGVSLTVKYLSMPSSCHNYRKGSLLYSPLLSERRTLIFLLVFFSIFFSLHKQLYDFLFVLHCIYPISPRVIINKGHKVVVTSNKWCLSRSPNIYVNIVKNFLSTINHGAKFHLGLLSDDAMLTKFQFIGLDTLQQTLLC